MRTFRLYGEPLTAVDAPVQLLKISEILDKKTFDYPRVYIFQPLELGDDSRQENDRKIGRIIPNADVVKREDLVSRGRQSHTPVAM